MTVLFCDSRKPNTCYGGDSQKYHSEVISFFSKLEDCGMKPVVLLDGAYDDEKRRTLWNRVRENAARAVSCDPSHVSSWGKKGTFLLCESPYIYVAPTNILLFVPCLNSGF